MAGDWIKVEMVTPDKPEVYRMAQELGITPEEVVGHLVRVWVWADQQSVSGNAVSVTFVTLDCVSRRNGMSTAMRNVGWLTGEDGMLTFPNFERHNGETAKKRALTNKRVKRFRNEAGVTSALPEKRREEITPIVPTPTSPHPKSATSKQRPAPPDFGRFWSTWPDSARKVARSKCVELWLSRGLEFKADEIIEHVERMKATKQWREGFDPAPLTYLNQRRWEDGDPPAGGGMPVSPRVLAT